MIGSCCARGKTYCTFNILVTLVGTVGYFLRPQCRFWRFGITGAKKSTLGGKEHNFLSELCVQHGVSQVTVTRIGAGKSKFVTIQKLSLTIKTTFSDERFQRLLTRAKSIATSPQVSQ